MRVIPIEASKQTDCRDLLGWNFAENAATAGPARVLMREGGKTGTIIIDIRLDAAQSVGEVYPSAINIASPFYVEIEGTVRGALYGED